MTTRRGPPRTEPIGLRLARTAKTVSAALDDALVEVGGSLSTWLVLVSLKAQHHGMQRELAAVIGIESATLTHHLNRMESAGLVTRRRDPENRRVHRVELTEEGDARFHHLRRAVEAFDRRLRAGLAEEEVATLARLLGQLCDNVADPAAGEAAPRPAVASDHGVTHA
ncbi:MAG: MarR family transcriptional regulator [Actinomycetota bacterium]|nr:MarR family transcriptional regulator [Actinomycetota bacterium]